MSVASEERAWVMVRGRIGGNNNDVGHHPNDGMVDQSEFNKWNDLQPMSLR